MNTREFTIALAERAGELLLDHLSRGLPEDTIRLKSGHFDIVTEADVAAERLIYGAIHEAFPDHGFHGEESANGRLPSEPWYWVVDPLDGTTNFAHGLPIFGVNIALIHDGVPVLSVTRDPSAGRTYWAERGGGAWMRLDGADQRLNVSAVTSLERALLSTGFVAGRRLDPAHNRAEFAALDLRSQSVRRLGSAALTLAWVAAGLLEAYWEEQLKPWDWFPGWLLIAEAGGRVSEYNGVAVTPASVGIVASNGQPGIHDEILTTIAEIRRMNARR